MQKRLTLLLSVLFICASLSWANASPAVAESNILVEETISEFPIFGKKAKTSNRKQKRFAKKRSRRNGRGVMRARKQKGKNNGKSVKGGQRARRGSKKKAGCNT